jgi:hypothetical protein
VTRPRAWQIAAGLGLAIALAAGTGVAVLNSEWARRRVAREAAALIEAKFEGRARVESLAITLFPRVSVTGRGLRVLQGDGERPLITIDRFSVSGAPLDLLRRRVARVDIDGVEVFITRGRMRGGSALRTRARDVRIDEVHVRNGRLLIIPDNPMKLPLEFGLQSVSLTDFRFDGPTAFSALLTNPKPRALIQAEGRFGPWVAGAPRSTPVNGVYLFNEGELDAIKGLGGHLTSSGRFDGVIERIQVQGTTTSTDFTLDLANQPMALRTQFKATVDGSRGDTFLDDVDATLGQSRIRAHGSVASTPGAKGRTVTLTVSMKDARFEDLLRLAVKAAEPPMRGRIDIDTGFELPPGDEDVPSRLHLNGRFAIRQGQFASDNTQNKIDELSRRGRGQPGNQEVSRVMAAFGSTFTLERGVLRLPRLRFSVTGARIDLDGRYVLHSEALDFSGAVRLDAPVSKMVSGFKSLLLRPIDPLFRRDGAGTVLPIRISGTVEHPQFGLDMKRVLKRN